MKTCTFLFSLLITTQAMATCMLERIECSGSAPFQNTYHLERVRCSPPGGPVHEVKTFSIYNALVSECGPVPEVGCLKPIFQKELNTTRHHYFQADLMQDGEKVLLKVDDRRFLPQGDFHLSTPNADYIELSGYRCVEVWQ